MSNESTSITRGCIDCGVQAGPIGHKCDKCYNRLGDNAQTHELAVAENLLRRGAWTVDELWSAYACNWNLRNKAERDITDGGDERIEGLWRQVWDALAGDLERDATWELLSDAIENLPDYRVEKVDGCITLKFYFSDLEIDGSLAGSDRDDAIIEAFLKDNDLDQDNADETEVEVD